MKVCNRRHFITAATASAMTIVGFSGISRVHALEATASSKTFSFNELPLQEKRQHEHFMQLAIEQAKKIRSSLLGL